MLKIVNYRWSLQVMIIILLAVSCKEDEPIPEVIASFQIEKDNADFRKVTFKNFSQNFVSSSWNFGDGSAASTEESPVHTFPGEGKYNVKLTATGKDGKISEKEEEITITDPNLELKKLTGTTSKSWKLIRDVSTNKFPLEVGPSARNEIWWGLGRNDELGSRPCMLNDEYVFSLNGTYEYKTNGDFWAESGVWKGAAGCRDSSVPANFTNVNDVNISAWGNGTHTFEYNVSEAKLKVIGTGAFIALAKAGTAEEVKVPQTSVTYNVIKLVDAAVDTMILETTIPGGYWRFVLVHYDNASQEPAIPVAKPVAAFTTAINGKQVTFTNATTGGVTYLWEFGDATTSTTTNPVHTYANNGTYNVKLTATNTAGSANVTNTVIVGGAACTTDAAESTNPAGAGIKLTLSTAGTNSVFGGFDGVVGGRVENPYVTGINQSCYVNQYQKIKAGCQSWAGAAVGLPTAINFASDKKKFKIKVYAVNKTTDVTLRLEKLPYPDVDPSAERTASITAVGVWQELTFDFSDITAPNTYKNLVIFFERGVCDVEQFYYFDDLQQVD